VSRGYVGSIVIAPVIPVNVPSGIPPTMAVPNVIVEVSKPLFPLMAKDPEMGVAWATATLPIAKTVSIARRFSMVGLRGVGYSYVDL
jgi:hypothetical protein